MIRCLQDHRTNLGKGCAAALFDHEVKMAEDIDFKYPLRKACAWEISSFCKDVPHGHARVIRCLQDQLEHEDMSSECKAEVSRDANRAAHDYRLNWRLNHACEADVANLCGSVCNSSNSQPCGGMVLQCLQDKQDNVTSTECQEEVRGGTAGKGGRTGSCSFFWGVTSALYPYTRWPAAPWSALRLLHQRCPISAAPPLSPPRCSTMS